MSPELIDPQRFGFENSRPTKSSECYALGMVVYETIGGHLPFRRLSDLTVFVKVLEGVRPPREDVFVNGLWEMLELCWEPQPNARPNIEGILQCLERWPLEPPPPGVNGEVDGGGHRDSTSVSTGMFPFPHFVPPATFHLRFFLYLRTASDDKARLPKFWPFASPPPNDPLSPGHIRKNQIVTITFSGKNGEKLGSVEARIRPRGIHLTRRVRRGPSSVGRRKHQRARA